MEQVGFERDAQMAVEYDGLWIPTRRIAHGQARVIRQQSANADQDGVVHGAQAVRQLQRFWTAERQPFTCPRGNTPIQALGVAQGDER